MSSPVEKIQFTSSIPTHSEQHSEVTSSSLVGRAVTYRDDLESIDEKCESTFNQTISLLSKEEAMPALILNPKGKEEDAGAFTPEFKRIATHMGMTDILPKELTDFGLNQLGADEDAGHFIMVEKGVEELPNEMAATQESQKPQPFYMQAASKLSNLLFR